MHTARRVASVRYAALSPDWGCIHPDGGGGGTPSSPAQGGHPIQSWTGVPHPADGAGGGETPWDGVPPSAGWDTTPPPPQMWTDRHLWKQYFPSYYVRGR